MPETQYDFKPVPEVRSFKEQMLHIADSDFWIGYLASGEETGTDYSAEGKSKENVIELLEASFSHMSQLIRALSDDQLRTTVQTFEGERDRMEVLYLMRDHVTHHRGQSVVYLRLQGIIPPDWVGS